MPGSRLPVADQPNILFSVNVVNPATGERAAVSVEAPDARMAGWAMIHRGMTVLSVSPASAEQLDAPPAAVQALSPAEIEACRLMTRAARWLKWLAGALALPPLVALLLYAIGSLNGDSVLAVLLLFALASAYVGGLAAFVGEPGRSGIVCLLLAACPAAFVSALLVIVGLASMYESALPLFFASIFLLLSAACIVDTIRSTAMLIRARRDTARGFAVEVMNKL